METARQPVPGPGATSSGTVTMPAGPSPAPDALAEVSGCTAHSGSAPSGCCRSVISCLRLPHSIFQRFTLWRRRRPHVGHGGEAGRQRIPRLSDNDGSTAGATATAASSATAALDADGYYHHDADDDDLSCAPFQTAPLIIAKRDDSLDVIQGYGLLTSVTARRPRLGPRRASRAANPSTLCPAMGECALPRGQFRVSDDRVGGAASGRAAAWVLECPPADDGRATASR